MTLTARAMDWLTNRGLDVELADQLGWASGRRQGGEALVIPTYRNDRIVARKYRLFDKPDQKWATEGETCFWNEDVLRDESLNQQPLIITEGQFDAMAAIQCGFVRTVSVPNGAPVPHSEDRDGTLAEAERYKFLREVAPLLTKDRFANIIIASDGDGPGAQLLHDLSIQLGRYRCKFITYETESLDDDRPAKDLNDILLRDRQAGVVRVIGRARYVALPGVYKMSELTPSPEPAVYEIRSESAVRSFELLNENYRMRLGDFAVVTGIPSHGKSAFVNDVCCRVADRYGLRVCWASFEQDPLTDHRRSLRAWFRSKEFDEDAGDFGHNERADRWIDDHHVFIRADDDADLTLDWLIQAVEGAVVRHGCKIVVIDPWNEIEHCRNHGESETEYTGRAIRTLKRFAKKFGVHLIVVAHPAKLQKVNGKYQTPSLYEISGSANFYNKCDVGIVVHRESKDSTMIRIAKSRYHDMIGRPGEVSVSFTQSSRRYTEIERIA